MSKLLIKNGIVYDPLNNIEGEKKDILVETGKIVDKFSNEKDIKELDANGKTVIPSAIDIHTHVASQQVNWVRLLGSNHNLFQKVWKGLPLYKIAKDYISMGYTFILEANVFPSLAKQTIFNFQQIPVLDKGMLLNISNLWPLELEFQRGKIEDMGVFISDLLSKTKGFGLKIYNPFECEVWNFKDLREDISNQGRLYNFSALDVYENAIKCAEALDLPHSAHAHIEGYENEIGKTNLFKVLERIKSLNLRANQNSNSARKRTQILHLAHINSYSINGDNSDIIDFLNENDNFSVDLSFVAFNQINPIITSDRHLMNHISTLDAIDNSFKLISSAVEFEGDSFASMRSLQKSNYHNCNLWGNAVDIALNTLNLSQICFSLNYPIYSNITDVPEIATWLVSKGARNSFMQNMNDEFVSKNKIKDINRVLNFNEFIQITRTNPAIILGIENLKGNLGVGSDADINILALDIKEMDLAKEYLDFKKALSNIDYVIKSGEIVKKQQNFNLSSSGSIFWTKGKPTTKEKEFILNKKKDFYQKYSSLFYDSYQVEIDKNFLREIG